MPPNELAPSAHPPPPPPPAPRRRSLLDWVEWAGNQLPDPVILFTLLWLAVIAASGLASWAGLRAQPVRPAVVTEAVRDASGAPVLGPDGAPRTAPRAGPDGRPEVRLEPAGAPVAPRSLVSADGLYWLLSSMLRNFATLPALPLLFVAMLGIGLAEKFGFFGALMRALAARTPARLLTPAIVLIGANASVASDAGYVVLPPIAAGLYHAMGRHPLAGLAAAFAGVAGGFGAGFFPTGGDGVLAGFAQDAARVVDPGYTVTILHNLWFKSASAILIALAGWWVTDRVVEPRLRRADAAAGALRAVEGGGAVASPVDLAIAPDERRALRAALLAMGAVLALFAALVFVPGLPLHGDGQPTLPSGRVLAQLPVAVIPPGEAPPAGAGPALAKEPLEVHQVPGAVRLVESPGARWSHVVVPIIFFSFLVPGLVFGRRMGLLRTQRDYVDGLMHGIRSIVPVLTIVFFMAQFVNAFAYTNLDRMLAYAGGAALVELHLPVTVLLAAFVLVVVLGDFAISGMLSKFGVLAPIFIPMLMMVGISPEATTAAYRIGDSVVNVVTPINSYVLVILAVLHRYRPGGGLGSLMSLMVPYSAVFGVVWTALLLLWTALGIDLGPAAPLGYLPPTP